MTARGKYSGSCVAFSRAGQNERLAVVVPCLSERLGTPPIGDVWEDTILELSGSWRNIFTGEQLSGSELAVKDVLRTFPVAVLWASEATAAAS